MEENLLNEIEKAYKLIKTIIKNTPLDYSERLSKIHKAKIYIKREDLQPVRSYKIRGAYNKISSLSNKEKKLGVVTASAGNHAQGVAFSCGKLKITGTIFMPETATKQKIERVRYFGGDYIKIKIIGKNFDESTEEAIKFSKETGAVFISAFNDIKIIAGQGTIAKEIFDSLSEKIDYVLVPVGGGGLISGISVFIKNKIPKVKVIGVEAKGADSMAQSLKKGKIIQLSSVDFFCDGIAIKKPGEITFSICEDNIDDMIVIDPGQVATTVIDLYQNEGIIAEPAGALSISALDNLKNKIKRKNVVCILSGGNNDLFRYPEIIKKSLDYKKKLLMKNS